MHCPRCEPAIDDCIAGADCTLTDRIIMPVMKPAYASMAVLTGMGAWNALLWPMLVLSSDTKYTIPIGLNTLWTPTATTTIWWSRAPASPYGRCCSSTCSPSGSSSRA